MKDVSLHDPYALMINLVDRAFMLFYRHVRQNARRIAHLAVALVPLMALLVGSCKTAQLPVALAGKTASEQFRMALFPDRGDMGFQAANYRPAAGYVSRARSYVEEAPQSVMMLTREEMGFLFGKPTLRRRDADADVWQYNTSACVVDFYFYGRGSATSYADVRMKHGQAASPSDAEKSQCLKAISPRSFDSNAA